MWWVARDHNKYSYLPDVEIRDRDMVIVHQVNTWDRHRVNAYEFGKLVSMIFEAKQ